MSKGQFDQASFRDASLDGANLAGASVAGADFTHASLRRTAIGGVDFSKAKGLDQDQINEACANPQTRLPGRLVAKACHGRGWRR